MKKPLKFPFDRLTAFGCAAGGAAAFMFFAASLRCPADPPTTTALPVETTGSNTLHGTYNVTGSGASFTATNGYVGSSGSASLSGSAGYAATAGNLLTAAPYNLGPLSGTATLSTTNGVLQSGSLTATTTLAVPTGGTAGARLELWLTASGTGQSLSIVSGSTGITLPSASALTFPQTLTGGKLYILLLRDTGTEWLLSSFVGGY